MRDDIAHPNNFQGSELPDPVRREMKILQAHCLRLIDRSVTQDAAIQKQRLHSQEVERKLEEMQRMVNTYMTPEEVNAGQKLLNKVMISAVPTFLPDTISKSKLYSKKFSDFQSRTIS